MLTTATTLDLIDPTPARLAGALSAAGLPWRLACRIAGRYAVRAPAHEGGEFTLEAFTVSWRREGPHLAVRVEAGRGWGMREGVAR